MKPGGQMVAPHKLLLWLLQLLLRLHLPTLPLKLLPSAERAVVRAAAGEIEATVEEITPAEALIIIKVTTRQMHHRIQTRRQTKIKTIDRVVKKLTRRDLVTVQMSQMTHVPGTGKKAVERPTAVTLLSVVGSMSSHPGPEGSASLAFLKKKI